MGGKIVRGKPEVCGHPGCGKGPEQGVTLYDVGRGKYCAAHFTGERAQSKPSKESKP